MTCLLILQSSLFYLLKQIHALMTLFSGVTALIQELLNLLDICFQFPFPAVGVQGHGGSSKLCVVQIWE